MLSNAKTSPKDKYKIACIYPIRETKTRDIVDRLSFIEMDGRRPSSIQIIISDDGSSAVIAERIQYICAVHGYEYVRSGLFNDVSNMSRARNRGVDIADAQYVMFHDIDLILYDGYFEDILREIDLESLDTHPNEVIVVGVIYLTQKGTDEFLHMNSGRARIQQFLHYLLQPSSSRINHFAAASSVNILHRSHYFFLGGYNEKFKGWGFEDSEFMYRVLRLSTKFPHPIGFQLLVEHDYRYQTLYIGWRSLFRIYGDRTFQKGIVLFHAWHPVENSLGSKEIDAKRNRILFYQLRNKINNNPEYNTCRQAQSILYSSILFDRYRISLMISGRNRKAIKIWAHTIFKGIKDSSLLFLNPFINYLTKINK